MKRTLLPLAGTLLLAVALPGLLIAQKTVTSNPPAELPPAAAAVLLKSLDAANAHRSHVWRDTPPFNADGTVNAYVEIPRGERRKWEFDMRANARAVDRVIPEAIGGYPVNYGYVPQTVSYDGDPFDALVLGPPLPGGELVRGVIVGLMLMADEKGLDSKVVLSRTGADGKPLHHLTDAARREMADYFNRYKKDQPGAFSNVPGWGTAVNGREHIDRTHAFYRECRKPAAAPCRVGP
jgi:inorganic pyrophosphatase